MATARDDLKSGNLGVATGVIGELSLIVDLLLPARRRTSSPPRNFINIIIQMAGTTMIAYGVVFVLLLGEIDLSVGVRQRRRRASPSPSSSCPAASHDYPGWLAILLALAIVARDRVRSRAPSWR